MSDTTKITVKCYQPLWRSFEKQLGTLPIKRDAFINTVLECEIPRLEESLVGKKKLSTRANRWIWSELVRLSNKPLRPVTRPEGDAAGLITLGLKSVNIGVAKSVADDLRRVIGNHNIGRDAFFNRLIIFLCPSDDLLKRLGLPIRVDKETFGGYGPDVAMPLSPIKTLQETFQDPLWYLHHAVKEYEGTSLYLSSFPSGSMNGFTCWIDDEAVPGTKENKRLQKEMNDWVVESELLDQALFPKASVGEA